MTRHAKNCTAGAVYTYHEKRKDAKASGYGSRSQRMGKDSVKDFDCCSLTLQPCRNPVITPDGVLYDKEAVLEYVVAKREEFTRKSKEYERQKRQAEKDVSEEAASCKKAKLEAFKQREKEIVSSKEMPEQGQSSSNTMSNMTEGRDKELPSFWIPTQTPDAKQTLLRKPDKAIYCPVSGKPLKIKELIDVRFTEVNDPDNATPLIARTDRYMCPVTHDILRNSVPCCVIKTTGDVVTQECVDRIIKKDWLHPMTDETLTESDIISLQRGGTGFASANSKLEAKDQGPASQC